MDNLTARHLVNPVHALVVGLGDVVGLVIKDNLTHHHAMLAEHLGEFAGVYARDARHVLALEPVAQTLNSIPMGVLLTVVAHDDGRGINLVALHERRDAVVADGERGYAVVAHQGVSEGHHLTSIRGVGETLGIAHHGRVEHHFASHRLLIAERTAVEACSVA